MDTRNHEMNHILRLEPLPRRIVILRALQLGDLLCAVPAFRALRAALPNAEIVLVGLPWAKELVERFNRYLDGFIEFPGYPGLPERQPQLDAIPLFTSNVQHERFDLALQMHGSGSIVNPLIVLLGARMNAGFYLPGEYCPDPEHFMVYPEGIPEIWRHLKLMEFLGVPLQGDELEFPLNNEDEQALRAVTAARDLRPGEYVCVHPGSRATNRRWSPHQFAAVADALAARGLRVVLTGSAAEKEITRAVTDAMCSPVLDLTGQTNLGALAVLLRDARLLVSNDTGVSHVAAALHVPSVVIFGASDPKRWAPLNSRRHRVVDGKLSDPRSVMEQVDDLLRQEALHV